MDVRDQLRALIRSWNLGISGDLTDDTPLISSGKFDSEALFNLVLWIEQQIGSHIDPTALDVTHEWNTIGDVANFIEKNRRAVP